MEFPALLNKQQVDFPGVNQHCTIEFPSSIEFPWVIKKNSWAVFRGVLVSGLKVSARCNTLLQSFQGHSLVLYRISRGKVKHVKTPGFFSKKYVLTPPPPLSPHPQLFDFFSGAEHGILHLSSTTILSSECIQLGYSYLASYIF